MRLAFEPNIEMRMFNPVAGRQSEDSLFDMNIATFEDDAGAYDQKDAGGFIKLNALRMRIAASKGR